MKKFIIALGIVVILLACITIFKNLIIKSVVTTAASRIIGAPVHIDSFSLNILSSTIHISGFKMYNPSGFPEGIMLSCPTIKVIYDRGALLQQKSHFLIVEIALKEMQLSKNKAGKLNVDSLKIVQQSKSTSSIPMQIDLLTLNIGKIVYKDCMIGTEPSMQVYDVDRHKTYKGILTAQELALLVLIEPMKSAAIKNADICRIDLVKRVAMLPVAVAETFIGKDSVQQTIDASFERVYEISLQEIKHIGKIIQDNPLGGVMKADINGATVVLMLRKEIDNKTKITISARKYMLPQLDIAAWVLYQIIDTVQDTLQ